MPFVCRPHPRHPRSLLHGPACSDDAFKTLVKPDKKVEGVGRVEDGKHGYAPK